MPILTEGVNAIVSLILGVGMFIVIIRVSNLIEKVSTMFDKIEDDK